MFQQTPTHDSKTARNLQRWLSTSALWVCLALSSGWGSLAQASLLYTDNPFPAADPYGLSPFWKWKTLESENFKVTYPEELKEIAHRASEYLEEAHQRLKEPLRWQPHSKTQVLVIDNADSANGLASPFAHFGLVLWATPPENWFSTGYYDDWLRLLAFHEYTHYLNMDLTSGIWEPLRKIFGDVLLPNTLWAPWMLEGLAVYMETRYTQGGRGRSTLYEMILRTAVEEGKLNTSEFMTLDKINGTNPWFPWGETRYQFGYYLMNQLSQNSKESKTNSDSIFGELSDASSRRLPFLINSTLNSVADTTWYSLWDQWVHDTQIRIQSDLLILKSHALTPSKPLSEPLPGSSESVLGSALSPDGRWIAYTEESSDRRQGLYLQPLSELNSLSPRPRAKRLRDKLFGVGMLFTPNSKALIYSRLHQEDPFILSSDLEIYCLEEDRSVWLTDHLRARDPSLSPDGKWITFTLTRAGVTGLARAPLTQEGLNNPEDRTQDNPCGYQLGPIEPLYFPPLFDRVSNPHYSADGSQIYFTLHPNGKSQEDLWVLGLESPEVASSHLTRPSSQTSKTWTPRILVNDGFYNRFPAIHPSGDLYFVSNATGVDNLYRLNPLTQKPEMVTHLISGMISPSFDSQGKLYATVYSNSGWNLAQVEYSTTPLPKKSLTLPAPPAPTESASDKSEPTRSQVTVQDYSAWSTLIPRFWTPLFGSDSTGVSIGAQAYGFDAINQHRYTLGASYGTLLQLPDLHVLYSNRSFGPELALSASLLTSQIDLSDTELSYSRFLQLSTTLSYPWRWTYSSLVPYFSVNLQKQDDFLRSRSTPGSPWESTQALQPRPFIPSFDLIFQYSDQETSKLAVGNEAGRVTQLGGRLTLTPDQQQVWKLVFTDQENFRLFPHGILSPSIKASMVSRIHPDFPATRVLLQGRAPQQWMNPTGGGSLNQIVMRGYPGIAYLARSVLVTAMDFRFPLLQIFRGLGTHPFFAENLSAYVFAENTWIPTSSQALSLPSAGGGVRLSTELFFLPVTLSGNFHHGFAREQGGASDLFFQVTGSLPF